MGIGDMRSVGGQHLRQNGHGWMEKKIYIYNITAAGAVDREFFYI
jgi:hypothetical protein